MLDYTIHDYRGIPNNTYRFTERSDDHVMARAIEQNIAKVTGKLKIGFIPELNITIHQHA